MASEAPDSAECGSASPPASAELFRDPHLAAFFPGLLVCDLAGRLVAADDAALGLLPVGADLEATVAELARPALEILAADSGEASVEVAAGEPPVEGIATLSARGGRTRLVIHLRNPERSEAVRRLVERNRIYEAVLRTGPVFVHVYDRDMNSRWATSSLRPELGHQPSRLLSAEENYEFVHPDDVPENRLDRRADQSAIDDGRRRIRVRHADGDWRWLQILSVNLLEDPSVGSLVVHAWDVTEEVEREREVEDARARLAALIDVLDEAVVVVDDERIAFANGRVREFFPGVDAPETLIGRSAAELADVFAESMADPEGFKTTAAAIVARGETVRGGTVETADGRTLEQNFLAIGTGERPGGRVWVYRDITLQLELRRRQEHLLELERQERQAAEQQAEALRELDDLKTEFVASVSHELRTPLSSISSYVELLLDPLGPPLTEEQRRIGDSIARGASRLARLVDDLLELARLQSGNLEVVIAKTDIPGTLAEAIADINAGLLPEVEIVQEVAGGPPAATDRYRVLQILTNLLGNAVRYASHRVVCRARTAAGGWVIEVLDDGPGAPANQLDRIFEPFYRVESTRGEEYGPPSGTGLGLAVSARLAERLGGSLEFENRPEGGALVRLFVPFGGP